jgi:hypothetical protein
MSKFRMHGMELRQLGSLLAALLEDSELMAEMSLMEKEHIRGASEALSSLFPIVEARDMEDATDES